MGIEVNNKGYEVAEECTLWALLGILELQPSGIAFAVDNKVIKRADWDNFVLKENTKVTMIKAVCGG